MLAVRIIIVVSLLLIQTVVSATTTSFPPCANVTSPLRLVVPNNATIPNGNANGLSGNARIEFHTTIEGRMTNINITYAFCSSSNPLLAENVVSLRFRSFINQTSFLDSFVPVCDHIQSFCNVGVPSVGCLRGAVSLNSSWPLLTTAAAPQIWIVGQSSVTYGRFKAGADHGYADGPAAPTSSAVLLLA